MVTAFRCYVWRHGSAPCLVLFVLAGSAGVIASASYLFFRDELFTASIKRQHQIQVAYEDRVSDLRREIDRITSRQLLNQQAYEARVERLLTEHMQLYEQGARLNVILDRAGSLGLVPRPAPPSPVVPPNQEASLAPRIQLGTMAVIPRSSRPSQMASLSPAAFHNCPPSAA
jgi:hypothetical protein